MNLLLIILLLMLICSGSTPLWGGRRLPILMYHKVRPGRADDLTVPLDVFESHLDTLSRRGCQSISFYDLITHEKDGTPLPDHPVLLTFDDAYADFEEHAQSAMASRGFSATVFLPVGCIGGNNQWDGGGEPLMDWQQVRRLAAGGTEFGLHSYSHDNYDHMTLEEMHVDLSKCMAELEAREIPYQKVLAYPYGGYPRKEPMRTDMKELFRSIGLDRAVRIGSRIERIPSRDPYELKRVNVHGSDLGFRFYLKLLRGRTRL